MKTGFLHVRSWTTPLIALIILILTGCSTSPSYRSNEAIIGDNFPKTSLNSLEYAKETLRASGISESFISKLEGKYLHTHEFQNCDKIIQMNVLGFLNPGDHSKHFTQKAVKNIKKFIQKYSKSLQKAESQFGVPKEVIASLLWVETRHGKSMGQFNLTGVYFSLIQASHPDVARNIFNELQNRKPSSTSSASKLSAIEIQNKVSDRLLNKSKWAVEQIKSIESLNKHPRKKHPQSQILNYKSSFAGAFGCSQFIPSSFEKYAVSSNENASPNLFDLKDCIMSVGNYLKQHGWDQRTPESFSNALFEYNRVRDYGDVILKLSEAAKSS